MYSYGNRFDEGCHVKRNGIRKLEDAFRVNRDIFSKQTRLIYAVKSQSVADVLQSGFAGIAFAAGNKRFDYNLVPYFQISFDRRSDGCDFRRAFVTHNQRRNHARMFTSQYMNIASTYGRGMVFQQYLAGTGTF
jgi:hypothetical protein